MDQKRANCKRRPSQRERHQHRYTTVESCCPDSRQHGDASERSDQRTEVWIDAEEELSRCPEDKSDARMICGDLDRGLLTGLPLDQHADARTCATIQCRDSVVSPLS